MTEAAAPTGSVWSHVLGYVSVIGPPATVVTALVFYFGWARAKAQAEWMGLHVDLFEGWSVEEGTVVVLPDDASLRVQYGR